MESADFSSSRTILIKHLVYGSSEVWLKLLPRKKGCVLLLRMGQLSCCAVKEKLCGVECGAEDHLLAKHKTHHLGYCRFISFNVKVTQSKLIFN